jgi:hypothetical protein
MQRRCEESWMNFELSRIVSEYPIAPRNQMQDDKCVQVVGGLCRRARLGYSFVLRAGKGRFVSQCSITDRYEWVPKTCYPLPNESNQLVLHLKTVWSASCLYKICFFCWQWWLRVKLPVCTFRVMSSAHRFRFLTRFRSRLLCINRAAVAIRSNLYMLAGDGVSIISRNSERRRQCVEVASDFLYAKPRCRCCEGSYEYNGYYGYDYYCTGCRLGSVSLYVLCFFLPL